VKPLLLSTSDIRGGASIAAYRLHEGLRLIGCESKMLVRDRSSDDADVIQSAAEKSYNEDIQWEVSHLITDRARTPLSSTYFSIPYTRDTLSDQQIVDQSDIVNIHWSSHFASPTTVLGISQRKKPLVMTLHDERAFSGGCHYTAGCNQFMNDCATCAQLTEPFRSIPKLSLQFTKECYSHIDGMSVVAPSQWLTQQARKSALFKGRRIECIPYGIDLGLFKIQDRVTCRSKFGLPQDAFIVLFGASSIHDKRKGFHILIESISALFNDVNSASVIGSKKIIFVAYGHFDEKSEMINLPILLLGEQKSPQDMVQLLSAVDLFVCPSLEDNLPNTVMEALACSTPVVGSNVGGIPDMVEDGVNGLLFDPFTSHSLTRKLLILFDNIDEVNRWSVNARLDAEKRFPITLQANRYQSLFTELIHQSKSFSLPINKAKSQDLRLKEQYAVAYQKIKEGKDFSVGAADFFKKIAGVRVRDAQVLRDKIAQIKSDIASAFEKRNQLKDREDLIKLEVSEKRKNPFWFLFVSNWALRRRYQEASRRTNECKQSISESKSSLEEIKKKMTSLSLFEQPSSTGIKQENALLIVSSFEINDKYKQGDILKRAFSGYPNLIHVRLKDAYDGKSIGAITALLPREQLAQVDFSQLLLRSTVSKIVCIPTDSAVIEAALVLKYITKAPLCLWYMNHGDTADSYDLDESLERELLSVSDLVIGMNEGFCRDLKAKANSEILFFPYPIQISPAGDEIFSSNLPDCVFFNRGNDAA
jgi:glycosyltransferase involved in cell wall biosynthesis